MALPTLNSFTANTKIESAKVNENFTNLRNRTDLSSSTDHITLTAGTSKLVRITVLRQDNTTDTYTANSVILTGWGYIQGNNSTRYLSEAVTFGITFSQVPVVTCTHAGAYTGGAPTSLGQLAEERYSQAGTYTVAVGSFYASLLRNSFDGADPGVFANTYYYGYCWTAVGSLT